MVTGHMKEVKRWGKAQLDENVLYCIHLLNKCSLKNKSTKSTRAMSDSKSYYRENLN